MEYRKYVRHVKVCKDENDTAFLGEKLIQLTILQIESTFKQVKYVVRSAVNLKNILWEGQVALLDKIRKRSLTWVIGP